VMTDGDELWRPGFGLQWVAVQRCNRGLAPTRSEMRRWAYAAETNLPDSRESGQTSIQISGKA
jgi:hypothetical protein